MKTWIRYSFVALVVLAADFPVTTTRSASTHNSFVLLPIPSSAARRHQAAPHIRNANGTSGNWAGYAVEPSSTSRLGGTVSEAKGTWTVPSVFPSDSANTFSAIWVGLDGYSDNTVEQTGTEQDLTPDGPVYYAWFEMYPKVGYRILNFPVEPGDTISAEVRYVGNNRFTLSIVNQTRNVSFSTTQRHKAKRESAEWIVEAPYSGGTLPLADFGTVTLTSCSATLNGHTGAINDASWRHDAITMAEPNGGAVKASPSALSRDGANFSVSWLHE